MSFLSYTIEISNSGDAFQPLAFRIMKLAYHHNIKGECKYRHANHFKIIAEGNELKLTVFTESLKKLFPKAAIQIMAIDKIDQPVYKEFDIIQESDATTKRPTQNKSSS